MDGFFRCCRCDEILFVLDELRFDSRDRVQLADYPRRLVRDPIRRLIVQVPVPPPDDTDYMDQDAELFPLIAADDQSKTALKIEDMFTLPGRRRFLVVDFFLRVDLLDRERIARGHLLDGLNFDLERLQRSPSFLIGRDRAVPALILAPAFPHRAAEFARRLLPA